MTDNFIKISSLVKKYRYKHKEDKRAIEALEHILWYSLPVVYPDCDDDLLKVSKAFEARKRKRNRANRYLKDMALCYPDSQIVFVTLTFSNDYIDNKPSTLHKYVQSYLNDTCRDYFANSDIGKKNKRLHYHAVCVYKPDFTPFKAARSRWCYGAMKIKNVSIDSDTWNDASRLSGYMMKLVNHSNKLGTGRNFHKKMREDVDELPF